MDQHLLTLTQIVHYLKPANNIELLSSIQHLYEKKTISYPRTMDTKINEPDLENLKSLLNIPNTKRLSVSDFSSIYGPIRPIKFPVDTKNETFSDIEYFLHELITDSTIAWLQDKPLSEFRNQIDDIETYKKLTT